MQAAFKRLNPSAPCPTSLGDLSGHGQVSMCRNLERFEGVGRHREAGWCLAHVADCLVQRDTQGAHEFLALTLVAVDHRLFCLDFDSLRTPRRSSSMPDHTARSRDLELSRSCLRWPGLRVPFSTHHNPSLGESGDRLQAGESHAETSSKPKRPPRFPRRFKDPPVPK